MTTGAEREAALAAVKAASVVCRVAQGQVLADGVLAKRDASPVTVADFASQAVVAAQLRAALGPIELVGEEEAADLREPAQAALLEGVVDLVTTVLPSMRPSDVVTAIDAGSADGRSDRFWTLDPIDGTKGFLRGEQYAIALALVEDARVVLGVLGCPNLPNDDGSRGAWFVASDGRCEQYVGERSSSVPVHVVDPASLAHARVCESVEAGHSDHELSARIVERLGITTAPYRIDSQCKYGVVARGDASIYLRLPTRPDYREKIWDHAAGSLVVEAAGGRVTDVTGAPLVFGLGRHLADNRGVVATSGRFHDEVLAAVRAELPAS